MYRSLVATIEEGRFTGKFADKDASDDPRFDLGYMNEYERHQAKIDRPNLRKLVRAAERRVPRWLREEFDDC